MSAENLDLERFILEVEARPALWDMRTKEYSNRNLKRNCWKELTDIFINKSHATEKEQNEFAQQLQKKWKGFRDSYNRECRQYMKSGSAATKKNKYIFFNQLSFLGSCVKSKSTSNSLDEGEQDDLLVDTPAEDSAASPPLAPSVGKRKKTVSNDVEQIVSVLKAGIKNREERESALESDGDRLFLLSLLNPIKALPENIKFKVKMEIMQAVERGHCVASGSSQQNYPYPPQQQTYYPYGPSRYEPTSVVHQLQEQPHQEQYRLPQTLHQRHPTQQPQSHLAPQEPDPICEDVTSPCTSGNMDSEESDLISLY